MLEVVCLKFDVHLKDVELSRFAEEFWSRVWG